MSPAASQPGRSSPHNLPSPPADDSKSAASRKSITSLSKNKPIKQAPRVSKRANTSVAIARHHHEQATHSSGMDGRHKRVWKACERCRMKKTKCDGEFPCKRCRDDGLVCTAGIRKKTEYKTLPKGYGEVLESTQVTLVATCHKLFSMLVNGEKWDLGDPGLNERGLPIVHNIAQKLGCVRPNNDIDLPTYSVFPEDETTMAQVARELQEQEDVREQTKTSVSQISSASPSRPVKVEDQHQHQRQRSQQQQPRRQEMHSSLRDSESSSSTYNGTERASSSELEHSDLEMDYRRAAFGGNPMTLSPQSFTTSNDMDFGGPTMSEIETPAMFPSQSPTTINFASWPSAKPQTSRPLSQLIPETNSFQAFEMLNQGLLESEFGVMKPHYSNSDVMMGNADPMIFAGSFENYGDYDPDQMKFLPQMK